ncbi:MAG: AraC family transcriptional regulator [bacterium]|nr:AraC family transcriptional regulator [bacterium]
MRISVPDINIPETVKIPSTCRERFLPLQAAFSAPLRSRGVVMAGISDLQPPYEVGRRNPSFHLVIYTLSGSARLETPQMSRTIRPGQLLICPAHRAYHYWTETKWHMLWFHLQEIRLWSRLADQPVSLLPAGSQQPLAAAMEGLVHEAVLPGNEAWNLAPSYARIAGTLLERELSRYAGTAAQLFNLELDALWERVNADLRHSWSVSRLARLVNVSEGTLHRAVTARHGAAPMQMVARLRLQRAEELLRSTDYPLERIAELVGYANPFSFSRAFKRYKGICPRLFRS